MPVMTVRFVPARCRRNVVSHGSNVRHAAPRSADLQSMPGLDTCLVKISSDAGARPRPRRPPRRPNLHRTLVRTAATTATRPARTTCASDSAKRWSASGDARPNAHPSAAASPDPRSTTGSDRHSAGVRSGARAGVSPLVRLRGPGRRSTEAAPIASVLPHAFMRRASRTASPRSWARATRGLSKRRNGNHMHERGCGATHRCTPSLRHAPEIPPLLTIRCPLGRVVRTLAAVRYHPCRVKCSDSTVVGNH